MESFNDVSVSSITNKKIHTLDNVEMFDFLTKNNVPFYNDILMKDGAYPSTVQNGLYIHNLGSTRSNGTHWTCSWVNGVNVHYFCSFGTPPVEQVVRWYKERNLSAFANINQYQHIDGITCGYFALAFAFFCSRGYDPNDFIYLFHMEPNKLKSNDLLLRRYLKI
jgi:hypothetical protein